MVPVDISLHLCFYRIHVDVSIQQIIMKYRNTKKVIYFSRHKKFNNTQEIYKMPSCNRKLSNPLT